MRNINNPALQAERLVLLPNKSNLFYQGYTGARFTNGLLPSIQIRWKLCPAVILLLAIRSQQNFAHATTAQLSCHVQKFVAITTLRLRWEWNTISIEFELR